MVELNVVEQRYQAVLEVLNDGATVTDVARRNGVARQTVHEWLRKYATGGLAGLVDGSARPLSCPHQMPPEVEARIVELRRMHPGWGQQTIGPSVPDEQRPSSRRGLPPLRALPLSPGGASTGGCVGNAARAIAACRQGPWGIDIG